MHAERSVISNESRQIPKLPSSHTLAPCSSQMHGSAQLQEQGGTWAVPGHAQGWAGLSRAEGRRRREDPRGRPGPKIPFSQPNPPPPLQTASRTTEPRQRDSRVRNDQCPPHLEHRRQHGQEGIPRSAFCAFACGRVAQGKHWTWVASSHAFFPPATSHSSNCHGAWRPGRTIYRQHACCAQGCKARAPYRTTPLLGSPQSPASHNFWGTEGRQPNSLAA